MDDLPDLTLNDPDYAWAVWKLMQASGWRHLPFDGGLLDQPQALMDDLYMISMASSAVKRQIEGKQNE